jgi:hypothetical protein
VSVRGVAATIDGRSMSTAVRTAVAPAVSWTRWGWDRLDTISAVRVLSLFIVVEWAAVGALAAVVRHNHWIYYQGGDQLWYYTSGWLLGHGNLGQPLVGYLWGALLAPLSWIAGPNIADAYPAIVLVDTLVLLPLALAALYGLARLIGGRRFAILALLVWLAAPFVGVLFTDAGYHERYTELILPQAFGLTAMADFPTMVAALVAGYFVARVLFDERQDMLDGLAAGVAAGAAIAIKPSTALFLVGPLLALAVARRLRAAGIFIVGLAPAVLTLALWKWRGYGYLPLIRRGIPPARPVAASSDPIVAVHLPHYVNFDWAHFTNQLDLLREHFWSGRLIEWLVIAGLIGVGRRSRPAVALVGGWFVAFAIVKGGYSNADIEDSSLLRIMIPTIPAFVLLLASLPFLLPRGGRPWSTVVPSTRAPRRLRGAALGGAMVVTAVVPFAAIAAAKPLTGQPRAVIIQQPLIPAAIDLGLHAQHVGRTIALTWARQRPTGGPAFYHVYRSARGGAFNCDTSTPAERCTLTAVDLGETLSTSFVDLDAPHGTWEYRVGVAANWLNDSTQGDVYVLSRAVIVTR